MNLNAPFFPIRNCSFGGPVDFSNIHLNRESEGVVSSDSCSLGPPSIPVTPKPSSSSSPKPVTPKPTPPPTTTTTTRKAPYVKRSMGFDGRGQAALDPSLLDLERLEESSSGVSNLRLELEVSTGRDGLLLWLGETL